MIENRDPVDITAAKVVGSGVRFYPKVKRAPMQAPPFTNESCPERAHDLTGLRKGRITVVRFHHYNRKQVNAKKRKIWLCQCDCGNYMFVTSHSFLKKDRPGHEIRCEACWYTQHLIDGTAK